MLQRPSNVFPPTRWQSSNPQTQMWITICKHQHYRLLPNVFPLTRPLLHPYSAWRKCKTSYQICNYQRIARSTHQGHTASQDNRCQNCLTMWPSHLGFGSPHVNCSMEQHIHRWQFILESLSWTNISPWKSHSKARWTSRPLCHPGYINICYGSYWFIIKNYRGSTQ